jgi:hypothetical protein
MVASASRFHTIAKIRRADVGSSRQGFVDAFNITGEETCRVSISAKPRRRDSKTSAV